MIHELLPDRKKVMETLRARRMIRLLPERYDLNRPLVVGGWVFQPICNHLWCNEILTIPKKVTNIFPPTFFRSTHPPLWSAAFACTPASVSLATLLHNPPGAVDFPQLVDPPIVCKNKNNMLAWWTSIQVHQLILRVPKYFLGNMGIHRLHCLDFTFCRKKPSAPLACATRSCAFASFLGSLEMQTTRSTEIW